MLELGCGDGNLLGSLKPGRGLGIDLSPEMIAMARERNPGIQFEVTSAEDFSTDEKFDFVILSDILNEVWDVQELLENVRERLDPGGRLLITVYSRLWELPLRMAEKAGLSKPGLGENWLTIPDIRNLLYLSGFETIRSSHEILFPIGIPGLRSFFNKFLVRFWPFNHMAMTNFLVARVVDNAHSHQTSPLVSVIVPARNEAGNIENILKRMPQMGGGTEVVFVEGNSSDDTWQVILDRVKACPQYRCQTLQQTGKGKGDAVRL